MRTIRLCVMTIALATICPVTAFAGQYADQLGKCLVESTSERDRVQLVRWIFSAASLHPAVEPISSVTEEQLNDASKVVADLMVRLLTESCRTETERSLQYEGISTVPMAFRVLGDAAGKEMFNSPEVAEGIALLVKHVDMERLQSLEPPD